VEAARRQRPHRRNLIPKARTDWHARKNRRPGRRLGAKRYDDAWRARCPARIDTLRRKVPPARRWPGKLLKAFGCEFVQNSNSPQSQGEKTPDTAHGSPRQLEELGKASRATRVLQRPAPTAAIKAPAVPAPTCAQSKCRPPASQPRRAALFLDPELVLGIESPPPTFAAKRARTRQLERLASR